MEPIRGLIVPDSLPRLLAFQSFETSLCDGLVMRRAISAAAERVDRTIRASYGTLARGVHEAFESRSRAAGIVRTCANGRESAIGCHQRHSSADDQMRASRVVPNDRRSPAEGSPAEECLVQSGKRAEWEVKSRDAVE